MTPFSLSNLLGEFEELVWIHAGAAETCIPVKVGTRDSTRGTDLSENPPRCPYLSHGNLDGLHGPVQPKKASAVVDDHGSF
jgi:hypothetical protein